MRQIAIPLIALVALLPSAASAQAAIDPSADADTLASAMAPNWFAADFTPGTPPPGLVGGPAQHGTLAGSLVGFPTDGSAATILTNGDVTHADQPNDRGDFGYNAFGVALPQRGPNAYDITTLRVDLVVPETANCVSLDYRFATEEFPEFGSGRYNDAFVVELDTTDWTTLGSGEIVAPHDFATSSGKVVGVNGNSPADLSPGEAAGTTYDAATKLLTTHTPVAPGSHSVYLSIFDGGDQHYDSAVFLDRLELTNTPADVCKPPAPVVPVTAAATPGIEPDFGQSLLIDSSGGKVRAKLPGQNNYEPIENLKEIPVGTIVDASKGTATLTSELSVAGTFQTANFFDGYFQVKQRPSGDGLVDIALKGGNSARSCPRKVSFVGRYQGTLAKKKKPVRRLWGDGKGKYRTRGRNSAGTVRGTRWLTEDTCGGTRTRVRRGSVSVLDFERDKTVLVKAGDSYFAAD